MLTIAREGIQALNDRYGQERTDIFFLFHRPRRFNPQEQVWMGHERKRGKLADLNAFLRGGAKDRFSLVVGETQALQKVKYVLTLDTDTQLPHDSAHCWNNIIRNNKFLECKSYTMNVGSPAVLLWSSSTQYQPGNMVVYDGWYWTCLVANTNQTPAPGTYWEKTPNQGFNGFNTFTFDSNLFEVCNNTRLLFNGDVADSIFRNNTLRYAPGQSSGAFGLDFSANANRRLTVTGNIIYSNLSNTVGTAIVYGANNVDENGIIRPELTFP